MKIFEFKRILPQIPNLVLKKKLCFEFEMLPFEVRNLSFKKRFNFFMAGLNQFFLPKRPFGYPVIAQVEPANVCNLSCPLCLTASENDSRPRAVLSYDAFRAFIDDVGDYLLLIILWNWGEPFLNPDIFKMISYAKQRGILLHSSTNGNIRFSEEKAAQLVDSGLDSLIVAVDGVTQETYARYRKGGNLETVLENIRTIVAVKKKKGAQTPRLTLRMVVTRHNEHEIARMRALAQELEVDFFTIKTVAMSSAPSGDLDQEYVPENKDYRMYEYDEKSFRRKKRPFVCMRPWKRLTLDALGEVIPCEYDYRNTHSFGNVSRPASTLGVWRGAVSKRFRKNFHRGHNDFYHCRECVYKNRVADDCTVERVL